MLFIAQLDTTKTERQLDHKIVRMLEHYMWQFFDMKINLIRLHLLCQFPDPLLGFVYIVEAENVSVVKAAIGQICDQNEETRNTYKIVLGKRN